MCKRTCKDCVHCNICTIVEFSKIDEKYDYCSKFGCSNFLNIQDYYRQAYNNGFTDGQIDMIKFYSEEQERE